MLWNILEIWQKNFHCLIRLTMNATDFYFYYYLDNKVIIEEFFFLQKFTSALLSGSHHDRSVTRHILPKRNINGIKMKFKLFYKKNKNTCRNSTLLGVKPQRSSVFFIITNKTYNILNKWNKSMQKKIISRICWMFKDAKILKKM